MNAPSPINLFVNRESTARAVAYVGPSIEGRPRPRWISPDVVINVAAALYSIEVNELLSRRRNTRFEEARALVVWCLWTIPSEPMSYVQIGRHMDGRDHSGVTNLHIKAIALRLCEGFFADCCTAMRRYFILTNGGAHERA